MDKTSRKEEILQEPRVSESVPEAGNALPDHKEQAQETFFDVIDIKDNKTKTDRESEQKSASQRLSKISRRTRALKIMADRQRKLYEITLHKAE